MPQFGLSLSSPAWIFNYVFGRSDLTLCCFSEKGWHGSHDITVVRKIGSAPVSCG